MDYRKMLVAYVAHVGQEEGVDFLNFVDRANPDSPLSSLTKEECDELTGSVRSQSDALATMLSSRIRAKQIKHEAP